MTKYLISFPASAMKHMSDEELQAASVASHAVVQEAKDAGVWVFGGGINEGVPALPEALRQQLVAEFMSARRAVARARKAGDDEASAHADVDRVKQALGERGPVWWDDAPDYNRHMARTKPYAAKARLV